MKFMKLITAIAICFVFVASAVVSASFASAGDYSYNINWSYDGSPVNNVRAINYVCADSANCNTLGTETQDSVSASNSITVVYPISSQSVYGLPYGYATYWMSPGYRMMEMNWNPDSRYDGRIDYKNLNFLKYANCNAPINSITSATNVNENEMLDIVVNVRSPLSEANVAPYAEPADADIVQDYLSGLTDVTLTIRDAGNNIVYSETKSNYVREDNSIDYSFNWTPDYDQSGAFTIRASTYVSDTKCSSASTVNSVPTALTVDNVNRAPVLDFIGDQNGNEGANLAFTISATDPDGDAVSYTMAGLPGATLDINTGAFSWTPDYTEAGVYFVNFTASDGSLSDSEEITITIANTDVDAPKYSNLAENPVSPVVYSDDASYEFNATWVDDVAVDSAWVTFNGVNYEATNNGDIYTVTLSDLGAGNYNYQWFANDTSGNLNSTASFVYEIQKSTMPTSVVVNPVSPITYGAASNFSCSNGGILYINGVDLTSEKGLDVIRGAGSYTVNCTNPENENYSESSDQINYVINKATPVFSSLITSPIFYGTASDYSASELNSGDADLVYELYRDGVLISSGSSVSDTAILGAGTHVYNYTTLGGENYTEGSFADSLLINQATANLSVVFLPNSTVEQGTETTATGSGCPAELTCTLERDGTGVSNPDVATLGAGVYNYTYSTTGNENFTSATVTEFLTVEKRTNPDLHLYIDGAEADGNVVYTTVTNASAFSVTSDVELYRNGALVADEDVATLGVGTYNYTAYALENENYTSTSVSRIVVVSQAIPVLNVGITPSNNEKFGITTTATGSGCASQLVCTLTRNGVGVANPDSGVLAGGSYNYTYSTAGNENYTAGSASDVLVVDKITPNMNLYLNGVEADDSIVYGAESNASAFSPTSDVELYRNGILVSDEDVATLGVGTYNYTAYALENENYTSDNITRTLTVGAANAVVSLTFDKASPQDYLNTIRATCSIVSGVGSVQLFRNGADVTSENSNDVVLGAGSWDYNCTLAASENYSSAEDSATFVISPIAMPLHLYMDGTEGSASITYGDVFNATGAKDYSEGALVLYKDGVSVSNPDISVLGAGNHNYTLYFAATQNFTEGSVEWDVSVSQANPVLSLNIAPSNSEDYGTETNVSGVCPAELACTLARNGVPVSNSDIAVLGAGIYNYTFGTAGNANYTAAEISENLTINKVAPTMSYLLNGVNANLSVTYPSTVNASAYANGGAINMFRDGTDVSAENGADVTLGAGTYVYEFNVTGDENHTDLASEFLTATVNKGSAQTSLVFDMVSPQVYGTAITATCSRIAGETSVVLLRNGTDVTATENGLAVVLGAGVHDYNCSIAESENYTSAENLSSFTIDKAVGSVDLLLNGVAGDLSIVYGANANASASTAYGTVSLLRDGTDVSAENGLAVVLGAGLYNYTALSSGDENYTESTVTRFVNVSKDTPGCSISSNSPVVYPNPMNVSASCTNPEVSLTLLRDGADVSVENGNDVVLGAGTYEYIVNSAESANYTAASNSINVTVNKGTPSMDYLVNGGTVDLSLEDPATVNASVYSDAGTANIFRDGTNVNAENGNEVVLNLGTYVYEFNVTGNDNWTSVDSAFVTVDVVDTTAPVVVFEEPTRLSGRYVINTFDVNVSATDLNLANITIYVWDEIAGTLFEEFTCTSSPCFRTFVFPQSNMSVNASATDLSGNTGDTNPDTREYDIDTVKPLVQFVSPTPANGSLVNSDQVINVTASDIHLDSIRVYLYDASMTEIASVNSPISPFEVSLPASSGDGIYYFNASASDSWGWSNKTETRMITIDTIAPSVIDLSVVPNSIWNTESVLISANITDLNGVASVNAEITLPDSTTENVVLNNAGGDIYSTVYSNTAQNGTFNARIVSIDNAGNTNDTENEDFTVNYAEITIVNSWIYGGWYPLNFSFQVIETGFTNSTMTNSIVRGTPVVNIENSILDNATLTNVGIINYCRVYDSNVTGGTCDHSYIDPSDVQNSNTTGSTVINSHVYDSNATNSYIENATIDFANLNNAIIIGGTLNESDVSDSNVTDSTLNGSIISNGSVVENSTLTDVNTTNSVINGSTFSDLIVENGTVINNIAYNGTFTYNGTTVTINETKELRYLVNFGPTARLTVPVYPETVYVGDPVPFDASASTDPNIENGTNIALTFNDSLMYRFFVYDNKELMYILDDYGNSSIISSSFPHPGNYTVYVTVTDIFGEASDSASYIVDAIAKPRAGGGGGGGVSCTTNWTCTEWSNCTNGNMTRTCAKADSRCTVKEVLPLLKQACTIEVEPVEDKEDNGNGIFGGIGGKITGAVTGAFGGSRMIGAIIFLIAILAAGGILWFARTNSKAKARKFRKR